jgi:hypothetical protein
MPLQSEPTVIPGILLSDLSIVEHGTNKRTIVGCFDHLMFPQFPATYGRFFVTTWIANLAGSVSQIELTCQIEEKISGHVMFSTASTLNFETPHTFEQTQVVALGVPVLGIVFQKAGLYTVIMLLNGEEVGRRDFNVSLLPTARPAN